MKRTHHILKPRICRHCKNEFHPFNKEAHECSPKCAYEYWLEYGGLMTELVLEGKSLKHIRSGPEEYSAAGVQHSSVEKVEAMIKRHLRQQWNRKK